MDRYEDFCVYAFFVELIRNADGGFLTVHVAVMAEADGADVGIVFEHLPHYLVGYTTGGGIAVVTPAIFVKRNKGQHIYRCFKEIDSVAPSGPVKTVSRIAAVHVTLEGTLRAGSALMSVNGYAFLILADKYGVVVVG